MKRMFEVRNNLEQALPIHLPDGRELQLPPRGSKKSISLTESEADFHQIRQLRKTNLIRVKEIREQG